MAGSWKSGRGRIYEDDLRTGVSKADYEVLVEWAWLLVRRKTTNCGCTREDHELRQFLGRPRTWL